MTRFVIWLAEEDHKQQVLTGNKAARLGELSSTGFPIPDGFCIPVNSYFEHINSEDIREWIGQGLFGKIREQIRQITLSVALHEEILANYRKLVSYHPGMVAVRSSSNAEDLSGHSFAGLYETILNVTDETTLLNAVRSCWASYWSDEAVSYRDQIGMDHTEYGMAVLVQAMVPAKVAGVLFTHAPMDRDLSLVEFVAGNGSLLVDGTEVGGRCLIERDTGKVREAQAEESLPGESLSLLTSMGRAIAERLGGPQDIEWCLDDEGRVWILQSRPITTSALRQAARAPSIPAGMDRVYDEPFSILGCDLAVQRHTAWVTAINRFHHTRFQPEAVTDGVFVYHTTPWRSVGFSLRVWMRLWKLIRWLQADRIQTDYAQNILPAYVHRLNELRGGNLAELNDRQLLAGLGTAIASYLEFQFSSYAIGEIAVLAAEFLERVSKFIPGGRLDFLSGLNTITVERDIALHSLGEMLSRFLSPQELERVDYDSLVTRDGILNELQAFQTAYGYVWADRYPRDPAWRVNREALMASLRHAAQTATGQGLAGTHVQREQERSRNTEMAAGGRSRFPVRGFLFRGFLYRAERFFPYKENRNHFVYRGVMVIQKYARELGARFHAKGWLSSGEDIFFLTWDEIQATLSNGLAGELVSQAEAKKTAYRLQVQKVSSGAGEWPIGKPSQNLLKGDPCSSGVGSGVARLVHGPGDLQRVGAGEVMVCRHFRPAWSAVFARLSGAVIEEGGVLSHGATLAREYGVPAVINARDAMRVVKDGSRIVVDGTRGLVLLDEVNADNERARDDIE